VGLSGTAHFPSGILPQKPEEARAFLQERLAFLGKVAFLLLFYSLWAHLAFAETLPAMPVNVRERVAR
jgi:hypothetical protein